MQIRQLEKARVKNKCVLLRVDFNVSFKGRKIEDDSRMVKTLPTIKYLIKQGAKIIIISHLGRPKGKKLKALRMNAVARHLGNLLKKPVKKMDKCIGPAVERRIASMDPGDIVFLENIRFYKEEDTNDGRFAKKLAALADIYVNDAFSVCHRAHASIVGISKYLPSYAGFLLEKEIETLSALLEKDLRPMTLIIGGAKIDSKIGVMSNFLAKADTFLIGGGLANTFLAAAGFDVGKSLYEQDKIEIAQKIMLEAETLGKKFVLPEDVVVADEISEHGEIADIPVEDVGGEMMILDIGKRTMARFIEEIRKSKVIVWNGPLGLFEKKPFNKGTAAIARTIAHEKKKGIKTIIGGGDTIDAIHQFGLDEDQFTHVSTGGGAMLEFLEGSMLPGIEVLMDGKVHKKANKAGKAVKAGRSTQARKALKTRKSQKSTKARKSSKGNRSAKKSRKK